MEPRNIAIVCQGGGSHAAYAAGALQILLREIEQDPQLRLTGLSGTSGGAICAMLAWYGSLKGGSARANPMLDTFWQANCATLPGEQAWNDSAIRAVGALPCEILFSPYQFPMSYTQAMLTDVWPLLASWWEPFAPAPAAGQWMRGDFFQLGEMIRPHMNFALVAALGAYCSIPYDIERWNTAHLESLMHGGTGPGAARKATLERKIRAALAMPEKIREWMDADGFPEQAPLRLALRDCPTHQVAFTVEGLRELGEQMACAMRGIPHLLLGAVDVGNGEFAAFSSERSERENGISLDAILASAALPWLFKAVTIDKDTLDGAVDRQFFWDGLFSQNPPIKNFISGKDNARKPDEVWVVQINPVDCDVRTLKEDIWDRRNELAGNLSLNQEVAFIGAINKRIDIASAAAQPYPPGKGGAKHVHVHRIIMDGASIERKTGKTLGSLSKSDRDPKLKDALMEDGQQQARFFTLMRGAMMRACDDLDGAEYDQLSQESAADLRALRQLTALEDSTTAGLGGKVRLIIDETTMPSVSRRGKVRAIGQHDALVRWHTRGVIDNDIHVNVEGESEFDLRANGQAAIQVRELRITCIEQLPSPVASQTLAPPRSDLAASLAGAASAPRPA